MLAAHSVKANKNPVFILLGGLSFRTTGFNCDDLNSLWLTYIFWGEVKHPFR